MHEAAREVEADEFEAFHRRQPDGLPAGAGEGVGAPIKLGAEFGKRDSAGDVLTGPGFHFPPETSVGGDGGLTFVGGIESD